MGETGEVVNSFTKILPLSSSLRRFYFADHSVHEIFIGAGVRPGSRATFVPAKEAKTIDSPSGLIGWGERKGMGDGPTRYAQTRPVQRYERPTRGPETAGVKNFEE